MSRATQMAAIAAAAVLAGHTCLAGQAPAKKPRGPARWEPQIQRFEARDQRRPPKQEWVVFAGSSSIRGWKLDQSFPGRGFINRGFGGSQMSDLVHYAPRIVLPYKPKLVLVYEGDNDIASRKTPQRVLKDFKALVKLIHDELPQTRIVFISIKPSIKRWKLVDRMREANRLVREFTETDERLGYVDVDAPALDPDGRPRAEILKKDGLHLNAEGYKIWADAVRPHLGPSRRRATKTQRREDAQSGSRR